MPSLAYVPNGGMHICGKPLLPSLARKLLTRIIFSDEDLGWNLIKALQAYPQYQRIYGVLALDGERMVPRGFLSLVTSISYVKIYTLLLAQAKSILQTKLRNRTMPDTSLIKLDSALRQTLQAVRPQVAKARDNDPVGAAALQELEAEITDTLRCLRADGTLLLPRAMTAVRDSDGRLASKDSLSASNFCKILVELSTALGGGDRRTRYAALSTLDFHVIRWFEGKDSSNCSELERSGLVRNLAYCLRDPDDFELISEILIKVAHMELWRAEIERTGFLGNYRRKGLEVISKNTTLRRLDLFIQS